MADEEGDSSPTGPPSLLDLSRKKALGVILSPDFSDSEFMSLEPHLQKLLFRGLRTEIARLKEKEDDLTVLERYCPTIDLDVYWNSNWVNEEDEISHKPFRKKWSYIEDNDYSRSEIQTPVNWNTYTLSSDPESNALRVCPCSGICVCPFKYSGGFYSRISSQLLLYRLAILFGMPPPIESDGYKVCWAVGLRYSDGASNLTFRDYKGSATTCFLGSAEASTDALLLVNYLISIDFCHTYDRTRAGRSG